MKVATPPAAWTVAVPLSDAPPGLLANASRIVGLAPVIRWPGGCFADSYDWRDGVGPREQRPTRTNFWIDPKAPDGPQKWEPNTFGTNEFVRFCQLSGAQPYLEAGDPVDRQFIGRAAYDRLDRGVSAPEIRTAKRADSGDFHRHHTTQCLGICFAFLATPPQQEKQVRCFAAP